MIADDIATLREENRRLRDLVSFGRQMTAERDLRAQLRLLCSEFQRTSMCAAVAVILRSQEHGSIESIEAIGLSIGVETNWQQALRSAPRAARRRPRSRAS